MSDTTHSYGHDKHSDDDISSSGTVQEHSEGGLGSTFVHPVDSHSDEHDTTPAPIIIDRVMSDEASDAPEIIDLDTLRDIHATHDPQALTMYDPSTVDLSGVSDKDTDIRRQKRIEVYHDGSSIQEDLDGDLPQEISVARDIRIGAESHIVDARVDQRFTRESFDVFAPPATSVLSRLQSAFIGATPTILSHRRRYIHRAFIVILAIHLIGYGALMSAYIAVQGASWGDPRSVDTRVAITKYTLGIARLTLTPTIAVSTLLPGEIGDRGHDLLHALAASHHGVLALSEILMIDRALRGAPGDSYGLTTLLDPASLGSGGSTDVLSVLDSSLPRIQKIQKMLSSSHEHLSQIRSEYRAGDRQKLVTLLADISSGIDFYQQYRREIHLALGEQKPMRYLILNQNRDEIRATGGFPGSVIFIEIDRGRVVQKASRDIYLYDWKLYPFQVTPPPGIRELTTNYGLRDANYDPILKNNLETMSQFHERSGYESLDGVITIHQGLIEDLLGIIGPVDFPEISTQITKDNFSLIISSIVEAKFGKNESAKDILFVFEKHLTNTLKSNLSKIPEIASLVESEIDRGEVMMAWRDERLSVFSQLYGGQARLLSSGENWFFPVFTSLSGNKSDRYIHRDISFETAYGDECQAVNHISMTLSHTLSGTQTQEIRSIQRALGLSGSLLEEAVRIQGSGANVSYTRIYLPKGSSIKTSSLPLTKVESLSPLADIYSFKQTTIPSAKTTLSMDYTTPRLATCDITPVLIRQSGIKSLTFTPRFR